MAVDWDEVAYSIGVNGAVCIICFFLFNFLRRLPFLEDFYKAKRKLSIPFRFGTRVVLLRNRQCLPPLALPLKHHIVCSR